MYIRINKYKNPHTHIYIYTVYIFCIRTNDYIILYIQCIYIYIHIIYIIYICFHVHPHKVSFLCPWWPASPRRRNQVMLEKAKDLGAAWAPSMGGVGLILKVVYSCIYHVRYHMYICYVVCYIYIYIVKSYITYFSHVMSYVMSYVQPYLPYTCTYIFAYIYTPMISRSIWYMYMYLWISQKFQTESIYRSIHNVSDTYLNGYYIMGDLSNARVMWQKGEVRPKEGAQQWCTSRGSLMKSNLETLSFHDEKPACELDS